MTERRIMLYSGIPILDDTIVYDDASGLWVPSVGGGGGGAGVDPATLALSSYFEASYGGSPWPGIASAGDSDLATMQAGTAPAVGSAVDTFTPAAFNGTSHVLVEPSLVGTDYLTVSAYTISWLGRFANVPAVNANAYADETIFCCTGDILGVSATTSGVRAWHFDGGWTPTASIALATATWAQVDVTFGSGTLNIQVNRGSPVSVSKGNVSSLGSAVPRMGRTASSGPFIEMDVLSFFTAQPLISSGDLDGVYAWRKARYPSLSLP